MIEEYNNDTDLMYSYIISPHYVKRWDQVHDILLGYTEIEETPVEDNGGRNIKLPNMDSVQRLWPTKWVTFSKSETSHIVATELRLINNFWLLASIGFAITISIIVSIVLCIGTSLAI